MFVIVPGEVDEDWRESYVYSLDVQSMTACR